MAASSHAIDSEVHISRQPHNNVRERPTKLHVRKKSTKDVVTNENVAIFKERREVMKGYRCIVGTESGLTYVRMPGETIRTSYFGRFDGQFSSVRKEAATSQLSRQSERADNTNHQQATSSKHHVPGETPIGNSQQSSTSTSSSTRV